ncbi:MAG: LysE family transporter [Clostridiales bacterium]|nr:LysE family transporter [Candidatus Cacconaster stercorequi]
MNCASFLLYMLSTAFTPGPNNIAGMSNAAQHGLKKGFIFNLGILTGQISVVFACAIFCNVLTTLIPKIEFPMRVIGAIYILYLAWSIFRSGDDWSEVKTEAHFLPGLLLCWLNPKYYLYSIVSLETYVLPYYGGNWKMIFLFAGLLAGVGFLSTTCWSVFGSLFRTLFTKHAKVVNTIMALLLVYCAVTMFL